MNIGREASQEPPTLIEQRPAPDNILPAIDRQYSHIGITISMLEETPTGRNEMQARHLAAKRLLLQIDALASTEMLRPFNLMYIPLGEEPREPSALDIAYGLAYTDLYLKIDDTEDFVRLSAFAGQEPSYEDYASYIGRFE